MLDMIYNPQRLIIDKIYVTYIYYSFNYQLHYIY